MNKKLVALILGAVITSGIGGFGTYAYFTDTQVVNDKVNISMGTLKGEANWNEGQTWMTNSAVTETSFADGGQTLTINNAKPGDSFYRDMTVKNVGTLNADTSIALSTKLSDQFDVYMDVMTPSGEHLGQFNTESRFEQLAVKPGTEYTVRINVIIKDKAVDNLFQDGEFNFDVQDFVTVGMHQTIEQ